MSQLRSFNCRFSSHDPCLTRMILREWFCVVVELLLSKLNMKCNLVIIQLNQDKISNQITYIKNQDL